MKQNQTMNIKFLNVALGIVLTATALSASAQKVFTEGVISFPMEVRGMPADAKEYFTKDSTALVVSFGAGSFKMLTTAKHDYMALVLDVPVASIKKVGTATPAELEEGMAAIPTFSFTTTTETKQISGFNCTKVVAKDNKSGKTYDVWITKDISLPSTAVPIFYANIGGVPIQYTSFQQGQEVSITVTSVTGDKAPAGTFSYSKDFEKVGSLAEMNPGG